MRRSLAVLALLALTASSAVAQEPFDPTPFIGQGDIANCADFASQADAQAVLRADPSDPNDLDRDRDGIACETRPLPKDLDAVAR